MANPRPKLQIPLSIADKIVEVLCFSGLIAIWVAAILAYSYLPEIIPVHFNPAGNADRYGHKISILFLPLIPTILVIAMTILNRFPHKFNYLEEITPANAEKNYRFGTRLIRYLKLFQVLLFGGILWLDINAATQNFSAEETARMVQFILIAVFALPMVLLLFLFLQYKKNKTLNA